MGGSISVDQAKNQVITLQSVVVPGMAGFVGARPGQAKLVPPCHCSVLTVQVWSHLMMKNCLHTSSVRMDSIRLMQKLIGPCIEDWVTAAEKKRN
jgi:hypothetical protein